MAKRPKSIFSRRIHAARPRAKKYEIRDDVIAGLGLCVHPTGRRVFFLRRTIHGHVRYATIGDANAMTVPQARNTARQHLAAMSDRPCGNGRPKTPGRPMSAFAEEFLDRHARHWKPATLKTNRHILRTQILPALGHLNVDAVTRSHVQDWFASMADRPGSANRAMPVLSMMMRMAELWGYRIHNSNPCKNTRRYPTPPMERFLTLEEIGRLNAVLARNESRYPDLVAIIRLLMLTGCRKGEIVGLQWDWIKGKRIRLPDSKSGPRTVWLPDAARAIIDAVPRRDPDCPFVFPGRHATKPVSNLPHQWSRIRNEAGLDDLRLHDLRHTWASIAAMNGVDMPTIAKLLGHALTETTERYVHLSDQSVTNAADRVSKRIDAAMAGGKEKSDAES